MANQAEIRNRITNEIITALEGDTIPWRRPWVASKNSGRPANVVSGKAYTGINVPLLELHSSKHGFASRWWGTFRQWESLGGQVKKRPEGVKPGEWGAQITLFRPVEKSRLDPETGLPEDHQFLLLRSFTVFNADQVEGVERFQVKEEPESKLASPDFQQAIAFFESIVRSRRFGTKTGHCHLYAAFPARCWPNHRYGDFIQVPYRHRFLDLPSYFQTVFHEMAHWSEDRLGWDYRQQGYEMGELVAEMVACYLASEVGIPHGNDLANHAAYLRFWLDAMKADSSFIFRAATQASKVTDFLLAKAKNKQPTKQHEQFDADFINAALEGSIQ